VFFCSPGQICKDLVIEKYFEKTNASKLKVAPNKDVKRKYKENYIKHGFVASGPEDHQ